MRLQRAWVGGSRVEMQADKWTVEGAVKSFSDESILRRTSCVKAEECDGILQ